MDADNGKANARFWGLLMLSIVCSIIFSATTVGQIGTDMAKARIQDMSQRQLQLRELATESENPNDPRRVKALMDQVVEDFQRILALHNEIVRAIAANRSLSDRFISDATGDIRKRSMRLQSSLKLPKPEAGDENGEPVRDLKIMETQDELYLLCRQIESFVTNPIIQTPGTVDAKQLANARRDLESVVQLSETLKKRADKQRP